MEINSTESAPEATVDNVENKESSNKRLLIGKNVEKIPDLSVSTLERQLVSIINDAASTMQSVDEEEMAAIKEHQVSEFNHPPQQQQPQQHEQPPQYQIFEYCDSNPTVVDQPAISTTPINIQSCLASTQAHSDQNEIVFVTMDSVGNQIGQQKATYLTANARTKRSSNQPVLYGLVTGPPGLKPSEATRLLQQQPNAPLVIMPQIAVSEANCNRATIATSSPLVNRTQVPKNFSANAKTNLVNALNDPNKVKIPKQTPTKIQTIQNRPAGNLPAQVTNPILNGIISSTNSVENKVAGSNKRTKITPATGQTKKPCPDRTPSVKQLYEHVTNGGTYESKKRGRKSKQFLKEQAEVAATAAANSAFTVLTNSTNIVPGASQIPTATLQGHATVDILSLFNVTDPKPSATEFQSDELHELMTLINETQGQGAVSFDVNSSTISASGRMLRSRSKL